MLHAVRDGKSKGVLIGQRGQVSLAIRGENIVPVR